MELENHDAVLDDPQRVFHFDEVAMYLHPTTANVIARKGAKNIYRIGSGNEKECVTVLLGGNALGESPPTYFGHFQRRTSSQTFAVQLA